MTETPRLLRSTPPAKVRTHTDRLAGEVRAELHKNGADTADLAEIVGASLGRANHLKAGRRPFTTEELRCFCEGLELDMLALLERVDAPETRKRERDVRTIPTLRGERNFAAGDDIEARSYDRGTWRVYLQPNESGYTTREARLLMSDLEGCASAAEEANRIEQPPVSIDGRALLLLPASEEQVALFADGTPKRVISETSSAAPDSAPHLRVVSDMWQHIGPEGLTKPLGSPKHRTYTHYRLLGRYELILTGTQGEEMMLLAKVEDRDD